MKQFFPLLESKIHPFCPVHMILLPLSRSCHKTLTSSLCVKSSLHRQILSYDSCWYKVLLYWRAVFVLFFISADDCYRVCETVWPEEGHEWDFQGEVSSHQADSEQDKKVQIYYSPPWSFKLSTKSLLKVVLAHVSLWFLIWFKQVTRCSSFWENWSVTVIPPLVSTSLKREMRAVSEEFGLQPVTTAMAFVYFEKLVLQGRLNKQNRKLVAAACVLLAAKISSDLRKPEVKQLIDVSKVPTETNIRVETCQHVTCQ